MYVCTYVCMYVCAHVLLLFVDVDGPVSVRPTLFSAILFCLFVFFCWFRHCCIKLFTCKWGSNLSVVNSSVRATIERIVAWSSCVKFCIIYFWRPHNSVIYGYHLDDDFDATCVNIIHDHVVFVLLFRHNHVFEWFGICFVIGDRPQGAYLSFITFFHICKLFQLRFSIDTT